MESLLLYDASNGHYGEDSDPEASSTLAEAIACMKKLKNLAINTDFMVADSMIHMLTTGGRGDGIVLADQLQFLDLRVGTMEMLDEVLRLCHNLRHLALVFTREELVGEEFTGVCAVRKLVSVDVRGDCRQTTRPRDVTQYIVICDLQISHRASSVPSPPTTLDWRLIGSECSDGFRDEVWCV